MAKNGMARDNIVVVLQERRAGWVGWEGGGRSGIAAVCSHSSCTLTERVSSLFSFGRRYGAGE